MVAKMESELLKKSTLIPTFSFSKKSLYFSFYSFKEEI